MNIEKLKNKILQLAIQGKLISQSSNDKPAYCLIEEINEEREQLIAKKLMKKEKPLPEITDKEKPFDLPTGWEWVRLGDVGITNIGLTYKPSDISDSGVLVLRSSNIQKGKLDYKDSVYVEMDIPESKMCQKGDILICARNGSKSLVGKSAIIDEDGMSFGAFMAIYRSKCNEYINVFLRSEFFRSQLGDANTVTINQITQNMLKNFICPLPPLEEQKRIVDKVNEFFALIDELENNQTDLLQTIVKTKGKLLKLSVQGKLVKQNEMEEPALNLLKEIKKERERLILEKKIKKEKPLDEISENEKPFDLPDGWEWIRFGDIAVYKKGPFGSSITKSMFVPKSVDSVKVYEQKNAIQKQNGIGDYYVTKEKYEELKSFEVFPGDIIVSCAGTIGETYIMPDDMEKGIINQALMRITLSEFVNKEYYLMYFKYILSSQITGESKGSAIKNIPPLAHLKNIVFPLPPKEEQKRIVAKYDSLMRYFIELENLVE